MSKYHEHLDIYQAHVPGFRLSDDRKKATGRCPFHDDHHASFSMELDRGVWHCHAGCGGGNIVTFLKDLGVNGGNGTNGKPSGKRHGSGKRYGKEVAVYEYHDESGNMLFQTVRFDPKDFLQRRPDGHGGVVWNVHGIRRVLYRLPEVLAGADPVVIVEGEKDVDALRALGVNATTSPMGAEKWTPEHHYNQMVAGRHVVVIADNDDVGRRHALLVAKSCDDAGCVVRVILSLPGVADHGDMSDWLVGRSAEEVATLLQGAALFDVTMLPTMAPGPMSSPVHVKSLTELAHAYTDYIENLAKRKIQFGLPEIDHACRGVVPGEVAFVVARSKVGKSLFIQNLLRWLAQKHQATLFLSLEQPGAQVFERYVQMEGEHSGREVEEAWKDVVMREHFLSQIAELSAYCWTVDAGGVSIEDLPALVEEATQRAGQPMVAVAIDYLGYLRLEDAGRSEYERVSTAARAMKRMAKELNIPFIVVCQVGREAGGNGDHPLTASASRDSGVIEESADLELGLYRPKMAEEIDAEIMTLAVQVLANRKGATTEAWYHVDRRTLRMFPEAVPHGNAGNGTSKMSGEKMPRAKKPRRDIDDLEEDPVPF